MSAPFSLNRVSMVLLGVESVERSLPFYQEQLGLQLTMSFPGFAFLAAGGISIGLSSGLGKHIQPRSGATEIVFAVPDVTAAHAALSAQGVTFTQAPRQINATDWAANFDDPDGHHFSIYGPQSAP